jgi:hypothetical protein
METVATRFKKISTEEIIKLSHEELAWVENFGAKAKISYDYAFKLVHM